MVNRQAPCRLSFIAKASAVSFLFACAPITSRSGDGYSGMLRNWSGACAGISSRRTTSGGWTQYVRVKGKWVYLYRAVDSTGATIDFLLSTKRDAATAQRFLTKALGGANHPHPRVINTDKYAAYPPAIVQLKDEGILEENCQHRPVQYLNNVLEQDHRAIKRRVRASQHFRSFWGAWVAGYEAIHMIRKGQACWSVGLLHRFILGLFAAAN
jgi:IS6 family transposase